MHTVGQLLDPRLALLSPPELQFGSHLSCQSLHTHNSKMLLTRGTEENVSFPFIDKHPSGRSGPVAVC